MRGLCDDWVPLWSTCYCDALSSWNVSIPNLLTLGPIHNPNHDPNLNRNPDIVSKMLRLSGYSSPIRVRVLLHFANRVLVVVVVVKSKKEGYSSLQASLQSPLRELTCHMGSHSVTCHPAVVTFPPLPQLAKAGTRFSDPGGMQGWVDLGGWLEMVYPHTRSPIMN